MGRDSGAAINQSCLEQYLSSLGFEAARIERLVPLGSQEQEGMKSYGYGKPLHIVFTSRNKRYERVLRTMSPDPFGHDRRADRAYTLLLAQDVFPDIPHHIQPFDCGVFDQAGKMHSVPVGEFFLLTEFVQGELYALDLHRLKSAAQASPLDIARAQTLASYLRQLHGQQFEGGDYQRFLRDTVGSGEGIFGLCDALARYQVLPDQHLQRLENLSVAWRWRLRQRQHSCARTHGDFHPFNLLFRTGCDFSVLDCSRGGLGDAADDTACLSINFIFFSLCGQQKFAGAMRQLWQAFWHTYLQDNPDNHHLSRCPVFFAWRAMVLACPQWYPDISATMRQTLLNFAERMLQSEHFDLTDIDSLLA